jgi:hypothetical protein
MGDSYPRTGGFSRRQIDLKNWDDTHSVAWLEDDFHHFGVTVEHDGEKIVDIRGAAPRHPYSTCPGAASVLRELIGVKLFERSSDIGNFTDMRQHCTHMFDIAGLAVAHAAGKRPHYRYEAVVSDRPIVQWREHNRRLHGPGTAELKLNGERVLFWNIDRQFITGPEDWAGQSMEQGFRARTEAMDIEPAEHATVLRRAILISGGRSLDPDLYPTAMDRGLEGLCYTYQKVRRPEGMRMMGSTLNFEKDGADMLGHVDEMP